MGYLKYALILANISVTVLAQVKLKLEEINRAPCEAGFNISLTCQVLDGYLQDRPILIFDTTGFITVSFCDLPPNADDIEITYCNRPEGIVNITKFNTSLEDTGYWLCDHQGYRNNTYINTNFPTELAIESLNERSNNDVARATVCGSTDTIINWFQDGVLIGNDQNIETEAYTIKRENTNTQCDNGFLQSSTLSYTDESLCEKKFEYHFESYPFGFADDICENEPPSSVYTYITITCDFSTGALIGMAILLVILLAAILCPIVIMILQYCCGVNVCYCCSKAYMCSYCRCLEKHADPDVIVWFHANNTQ